MAMDFRQKLFYRDNDAKLGTEFYSIYHVLDDIKKMIFIELMRDDEIRQAFFIYKTVKSSRSEFLSTVLLPNSVVNGGKRSL